MSGPENFVEAEKLAAMADDAVAAENWDAAAALTRLAAVHATLALAAATAGPEVRTWTGTLDDAQAWAETLT